MTAILKVDTIQDTSGNNIINESSDTITIGASGDTTNIIGTLQNNGSVVGGVNTPSFQVKINSEQTPSNNTITKVNFDTEDFDTASAYDTSNKRFVVPSGKAGKYFFYSSTCVGSNTNASYQQSYLYIYKNNSAVNTAHINTNDDGNGRYNQMVVTSVLDLNASDYIEIFAKIILASGGCEIRTAESVFGGYKIIE